MNAPEMPRRWLVARALVSASAAAGALLGSAEAARVILGERLLLTDIEVLSLLTIGALGGAALAAAGALPLTLLPSRPLGRARWLGFIGGLSVPTLSALGVRWFSDPPPFTKGVLFQGNLVAFCAIAAGVLLAAGIVYQAARGARAAIGAALTLTTLVAAWAGAGVDSLPPATEALPTEAPNVLLVTLDTTRADRMGAYGNTAIQTRAFDEVAREGALFSAAVAVAPVTGPSHASLLSGAGPWDHGVLLNGIPLPPDRPLLAEVLRSHGWTTAGFVSAYVLDGRYGFSRGFGVYDDAFGWIPGAELLLPARMVAMARRHADPDEVLDRRGADTVDRALEWLRSPREGRWFLWVHLFDAHGPYTPPPPYDTLYYQGDRHDPSDTSMAAVKNVAPYLKESLEGITDLDWVLAQYDGEVSYADAQLGRLLAAIDKQNTLVAIIGDHGESLGEHDVWFNHGDDVYETSVRVPFALRWPGHVPVTTVVSPFEGTDLTPTLLELLGVEVPSTMTGRSAVAALGAGPGRSLAHSLCFDRPANQAARERGEIAGPFYRTAGLRGPDSHYVGREVDGSGAYFELRDDPLGLRDVAALKKGNPDGLLEGLDRAARALFAGDATLRSAVEVPTDEQDRLEALGYLSP